MSDWDEGSDSDSQPKKGASPAKVPPPAVKAPIKSKWEGEDEDEDNVASDWEEESSSEEDEKPAAPVAPPKKKGTVKQKIAEKAALKEAAKDDSVYDSDDVLDPRAKAQKLKELELKADLSNATDLLGAAALGGTSDKVLDQLVSANPRTLEEYHAFSTQVVEYIIKRHQGKPLYAAFVEHHIRELCQPMKDVEVRKAASGLTTLANEKQKEAKDKASGKKKPKAGAKPALASIKGSNRMDTNVYDEALDDFGNDDFM